ncbi:hypothetical protein GCM10010182_40940 [Actinomadura cremea]|nr:hypothetical protein GCM10010182_40940 [Actinomadura cremea]
MSARDFEIYLLQTMACDDRLRNRELQRLNVSAEQAERTKREVSDATRLAPGQLDNLLRILGPDAASERLQDDGHAVVRYIFDSWPTFTFVVTANELGIWIDARFVRTTGESVTMPTHPRKLEPWLFSLDEISDHFGPLLSGDSWPPFSEWSVPTSEGNYDLIFSWGLLQTAPKLETAPQREK